MTPESIRTQLSGLLERLGQPALDFGVETARWPSFMKASFVELGPDDALITYLEGILASRASVGRTRLQRLMRLVMSDYDVNALLDMYPMHLFSTQQAQLLLSRQKGGRLLDIGAGSGDVTAMLQPLFDSTTVVETSWGAARRLRERGFVCERYDVTSKGIQGGPYDVVGLLNVLDRTERPLSLLRQCHSAMVQGSALLLSIPLPYRPHAYRGPRTSEPTERLPVVGKSFSDSLLRLVTEVVVPARLLPIRLTRLPYLSGGDSERPLTVLSAAVMVCHKAD